MPRGKENDESLIKGGDAKNKTTALQSTVLVEETIDIESVDGPVHSDTEYTEDGRPIRKRKAKVPFDEDTDMDTDELLEKEVKTKKKPVSKAKAARAVKDEDTPVKAPRKTVKKPTRSAFSDDGDMSGKS